MGGGGERVPVVCHTWDFSVCHSRKSLYSGVVGNK